VQGTRAFFYDKKNTAAPSSGDKRNTAAPSLGDKKNTGNAFFG